MFSSCGVQCCCFTPLNKYDIEEDGDDDDSFRRGKVMILSLFVWSELNDFFFSLNFT